LALRVHGAYIIASLAIFAITTLKYITQADISIALPVMFGLFTALLIATMVLRLRKWPMLELNEDGLYVSKFRSPKFLVKWSEIESIEDIRHSLAETGRKLRSFRIRSSKGVVMFDQFYARLPDLVARLNDEIRAHKIPVVMRNYEIFALREAINACHSPAEKKLLRKEGLVTYAQCLEPGRQADWR